MGFRELSDNIVATTSENPVTPAPKPIVDFEMCKACGTLMFLNGRCPLCNLTRGENDKIKWDKFKRDE